MDNIEIKEAIDPVSMTKILADKIGLDQLYAIVCDLKGINPDNTIKMLEARIDEHEKTRMRLKGEIHGLAFALKCNGVSGGDVDYENY